MHYTAELADTSGGEAIAGGPWHRWRSMRLLHAILRSDGLVYETKNKNEQPLEEP